MKTSGSRKSLLAWAGWQLDMPSGWQPLKISGMPDKGQMIIGDSTCAFFLVNWEKAPAEGIPDVAHWGAGRMKRHGVTPQANPPAESRFTACVWAKGVQSDDGKETTYWYGYSEPARLILGVTVNGALPEALRNELVSEVLPTLRTTPLTGDCAWAMYDVEFRVPSGFGLVQKHLFSGDVALEFARGKKETLMVRQVYPGELALGRRSADSWLASYPFREHRRIRSAATRVESWQCRSRSPLSGVKRTGWKRLAFPMGWCSPRQTCALAVHDRELNRLLIAEHMTPGLPDPDLVETAIVRMNTGH